jgi:predicted AlkP superfamily pyrophosphatase or phosphodiesterase
MRIPSREPFRAMAYAALRGRRLRARSRAPRDDRAGWRRLVLVLQAVALLWPGAAWAAEDRPATVVLVSLDGTRPVDVTPAVTPRLAGLAERGAVADRMTGVVPTNTFPSHASLVTGVAPERHGLVNNVFEDPEKGVFRKQDIATWIEVEPLWSMLERAGLRTASFYWVGSEGAWPGGLAPSDWKPFSSRTKERTKVDGILEWLDRPAGTRPRLVTSWFHGADHAAHDHGPGSPEATRALAAQDVEIGRLVDGLAARGRLADTTLLFVSDHGMTTAERHVDLGSALAKQDGIEARVYGIGGFATVVLHGDARDDPDAIARIVARARALGLEAAARSEAPAAWRVDHPRFGDVVVRAPLGTAIVHPRLDIVGFHGYAPDAPDMAALFVAIGRGVPEGARLGEVRTVDVAPTVLALLGQPVPEWMEGEPIAALVPPRGHVARRDAAPASATAGGAP